MKLAGRIHQATLGIRPRMRPSLIIIGAQKAGTSALFEMLRHHPQVLPPQIKEVHHFDQEESFAKGMGHYLSFFPRKPFRPLRRITFEATPSYLFFADRCAPRIARALPDVLCLAILRDPVKRAYSAWNMFRDFKGNPKRGNLHDPRSFRQAVDDELAGRTEHVRHRYLARGCYAGQIAQFQAAFPKEQLPVHSYLELKQQPEVMVNRLCTRLGLPPMPDGHAFKHVRANTRPYPEKLDPGLAKELYRYFDPEMKKLNEVLGYEIDLLEGNG